MDAITRPNLPKESTSTAPRRDPSRRLWQAPVFVLGLAAVIGVWFLRPCLTSAPSRFCERELAAARAALDHGNGDAEGTAQDLQRLIDRGILAPEREGEAHFLYGTALMRVAERSQGGQADERWLKARQELEQAAKLDVPDGDKDKLLYRLAKAACFTESDPAKVVGPLAASVKFADDRAEGYNLLTQAYLRLTPPNLTAALEANEQLRQMLVGEETLAPARLVGGELLLRLKRPDDARKVLGKVGNQASPEIRTQAHILRAHSYQDEQNWAAAATAWQAALADPSASLPQAGLIRYNLGLCYRRLDQPQAATPIWEECVRNKSGDESFAASLELADLQLQDGKNDKAVLDRLEEALRTVRKPDDWTNKILDRGRAGEIIEHCCQTMKQAGKFDLALQLVALYERIALPGRGLVMRGEMAADWAEVRLKAAQNTPPAKKPAEEQAARDLFKRAAEDYELAAQQAPATPEQANYLWQAVRHCIRAKDPLKAQMLLDQLAGLAPRPDALLAQGWFLLGESFRKEIDASTPDRDLKMRAAETAYKKCIEYHPPTIFAYRGRYQIAQFARERGEIDYAVSTLEQIKNELRGLESDPAMKESLEQACFALVDICYGRKEYQKVVHGLEEVLQKLPPTMEATIARFELADSYRLLADEQDHLLAGGTTYKDQRTRDHWAEACKRWRTRAVEEFETLVATIEKPESAAHLDTKQRRDVYLYSALAQFQLGNYEKALAAYDRMAQRYSGQPDHWTAVAGMVSCYTGMDKDKKVREYLQTIRDGLKEMDLEMKRTMEQYVLEVEKSLAEKAMKRL